MVSNNSVSQINENYFHATLDGEGKDQAWSEMYFSHHILPHLPVGLDAKILDLGCGHGTYVQALRNFGYADTTGVDISEDQIRYAREELGIKGLVVEDSIDFFYKTNEKYDVILALDILEHLEVDYTIDLLKLMRKSLSEKGKIIIQVPNAISPLSVCRYGDITHKRAYTVGSMKQVLNYAGFSLCQNFPLYPFPHGFKSRVRLVLWKLFLYPMIKTYLLIANGESAGDIYTSNFLTVVTK